MWCEFLEGWRIGWSDRLIGVKWWFCGQMWVLLLEVEEGCVGSNLPINYNCVCDSWKCCCCRNNIDLSRWYSTGNCWSNEGGTETWCFHLDCWKSPCQEDQIKLALLCEALVSGISLSLIFINVLFEPWMSVFPPWLLSFPPGSARIPCAKRANRVKLNESCILRREDRSSSDRKRWS